MGKVAEVAVYTDPPAGIVSAVERAPTPAEMSELLEAVASAAHPGAGSLKALAHVVRVLRRCPWLTGSLRMELERAGDGTSVHLFAEHGGGHERVLPAVVLAVGLDEVHFEMRSKPDLFAPLRMSASADGDDAALVFRVQ